MQEDTGWTITAPLSDVGIVVASLISSNPAELPWFIFAAKRAIENNEESLVFACTKYHITGLLETALKKVELWETLSEASRKQIIQLNLAATIVSKEIWRVGKEIQYVLTALGVAPHFLKGFVSADELYDRVGERYFKDIDILVTEEEANVAFEALKRLGFVQGKFSKEQKRIVPCEVDEPADVNQPGYEFPSLWRLIKADIGEEEYRLLVDYSGTRVICINGDIWVPVAVEVHFALLAKRNVSWKSSLINEGRLAGFLAVDRETQFLMAVYKGYYDIVLLKYPGVKLFCDAVRLLNNTHEEININNVLERAHKAGLCAPFKYFIHHYNQVFGLKQKAITNYLECDCSLMTSDRLDLGDFLPFLGRTRTMFSIVNFR